MRVLQLVTVLIELLGDKAQPYVGIVAEALPKVTLLADSPDRRGQDTCSRVLPCREPQLCGVSALEL